MKTLNLLFLLGDGTFGRGKKKDIFFFLRNHLLTCMNVQETSSSTTNSLPSIHSAMR